jgi:RND family efflux transporter MFP subunit
VAQRNAERSERLLAAGAIAETQAEQARTGLTAARSQLQAARAQQAQASRQLGSATVTAPFAGIVGSRAVSTGDVVNVGTQLYTVVDPSSMQLEGSVSADQLSQVRVGAPVRFSVTGYPDRAFTGRITRVAPVADPTTRQVQIIASIPNVGNQLVGGLFAEGRVASETRDALVVPLDAVDQRGVRPSVVRVKAGTRRARARRARAARRGPRDGGAAHRRGAGRHPAPRRGAGHLRRLRGARRRGERPPRHAAGGGPEVTA